jgi:DNA-binding FrmR family transcriptional regulator
MAAELREDVLLRLRKIEGQVRGLQRMIEEGKGCADVVYQLSAVRKALDKVGFLILSRRMQECMERKRGGQSDAALEEAMELFLSLA